MPGPAISYRPGPARHAILRIAAESRGQSLQVWIDRAVDTVIHQQARGDAKVRAALGNGAPPKRRKKELDAK